MISILSPFVYIIRTIFEASYSITGSYGASIVLLSFAISLLLLPIFIYIEKAKKRDDIVKKRMQSLVEEIKQVYTGQERYYYLKTLNRQVGYSQFKALIPILSLLVQIPFFIAAYQYLETLKAIKGVSYGPLSDLSKPDHLFGIVNVLPVIMTVVNLLTAWFYTRNGNTSERKQMLVVAGVFLVLLFNLPSGLVLYWTMNNVFAFLRLFITNREVFHGRFHFRFEFKEALLTVYLFLVSFLFIAQINWAIEHGFPTLPARLVLSILACFILVSLFALLWKDFRAQFILFLKTNKKRITKIIGLSIFLVCLAQLNWMINHGTKEWFVRILGTVVGAPILILLLTLPGFSIKLILEWQSSKKQFLSTYTILYFTPIYFYFSSLLFYDEPNKILLLISAISLIPIQIIATFEFIRGIKNRMLGISLIVGFALVFVFGIQLVNILAFQNAQNYSFNILGVKISSLSAELQSWIVPGFVFILISYLFSYSGYTSYKLSNFKDYLKIFVLSVSFILFNTFFWDPILVYSSFPEAYDFTSFQIIAQNSKYVFLILIILIGIFFLVNKRTKNALSKIALFLTVSVLYQSILNPVDVGTLQLNRFSEEGNLKFSISTYIIEYFILLVIVVGVNYLYKKKQVKLIIYSLILLNIGVFGQSLVQGLKKHTFSSSKIQSGNSINFSKDEQNIVYVVLDMFQGVHLQEILKDQPELRKEFSGFTDYNNTLAISRVTNTSIAPLFGGYDYDPLLLNQNKKLKNKTKITRAHEDLFKKLQAKGFSVTTNKYPYTEPDSTHYDVMLTRWSKDWDMWSQSDIEESNEFMGIKILTSNSLLFAVPKFLKAKIYNKGNWLISSEMFQTTSSFVNNYRFLKILPYISRSSSNEKCFTTLYYFNTHFPWNKLGNDNKVIKNVTPYENQKWALNALFDWFQWMKANDVYDNTRIIIASDHGVHWKRFNEPVNFDEYITHSNNSVISDDMAMTFNALLFVKDFNATGDVKINSTLMSNADIPELILHDGPLDSLKYDPNRTLNCYESYWSEDMSSRTNFLLAKKFSVTKNMFNLNNWKQIE
ncbi:MAG TPA: membrane protein insertase YidC [Draconibacterium sp.]|nr:membrane protein insertase YidC [Draconibacterium sp.]